MAKHYDNIDDVKSKLVGTIIYYAGLPVLVKGAVYDEDDPSKFKLHITTTLLGRHNKFVPLNDPELNWTRYNIGYHNMEHGSIWWYRKPVRQYRQGLKGEQMNYVASERTPNMGYAFQVSKPIEQMLLDDYPKIEEIEQRLKDGPVLSVAFHRDFALSWDKIHKDMILEHKGRLIGCMSSKMTDVRLSDDYQYLAETIKEVIGVR